MGQAAATTKTGRDRALQGGVRVLPQPRPGLREPLRPEGRLLPGPGRARATGGLAVRAVRPADLGLRLHRDQRLGLRLHRPAGQPGPGQPLRRPRRAGARSSTRSSPRPETADPFVGSLRRRHPRDDSRRATSGWACTATATRSPTTSPTCTTRRASPGRRRRRSARSLSRLYTGSEIGQGYHGDEDNGEKSAWYLFCALGFYPLVMGSAEYAIGSPLFTKATVHLENGKQIVIKAPEEQRAQRLRAGR